MRRLIGFPCSDESLVGTLDGSAGRTGLLIVSGGNEIRIGAHRGMAELAARLAQAGVPVLRYDRRGIGDSTGVNTGFEASAPDIAAAAATFRAETGITRLVAFGNCDAASALALFHASCALDAIVLSNPWIGGAEDALPAPAAIRARYAARLRDPREWLRLLRGGVDLRKLAGGLRKMTQSQDQALLDRMAAALVASRVPATILLADRDNTAIAFRNAWKRQPAIANTTIETLKSASHSYAGAADKDWLFDRLLEAVRRYSAA